MNRLYKFIQSEPFNKKEFVVLDFEHLEHLQPNILDKIIEIRSLEYKLVFINISESIIQSLSLKTIVNSQNIINSKNGYDTFYFFQDEASALYSIELKNRDIFYEYFKNKLTNYIDEYKKPHASSYIYLHSFVDLKKFISIETPLIYFALYRLALKIKSKWKSELINNPILVSQSLTSTYIVSILSKLLQLDILVFDKIGPITKLYNKIEKHNFENRKYIVVSDLVCLGTEVKITKSLIEFSGGKYLGNVSLVKIETLAREHLTLDNIDRTISVFSISDKNNIELGYYIYTNLNPLHE